MALKPPLPNEPRIYNPQHESELTVKYLLGSLNDLHACFLAMRLQLDPLLRQAQPVKLGKPYPLGQCLEISLAVQRSLRTQSPDALPISAARGLRALRAFMQAGGSFRQVWGDLRGEFFQNAFLLGTLYVDVSNDTVNPAKPKIEILPFDQARFVPVRDFTHFSELAQRYWKDQVFPNHVLPELAPWCPLVHINTAGRIQVHSATQYMLGMTLRQGFEPSETVLRQPPMPDDVFGHVQAALKGRVQGLANTPGQGRTQALQNCSTFRARRLHKDTRHTNRIAAAVKQANTLLAGQPFPAGQAYGAGRDTVPVTAVAGGESAGLVAVPERGAAVPAFDFDPLTVDLGSLPPGARPHVEGLRFVAQELHTLNARVAAMQMARQAYLDALNAALAV